MELTQEYLDKQLDKQSKLNREYFDQQINRLVAKDDFDKQISRLVTKEDLDLQIKQLATKDDLDNKIEELTIMVADGFEDIQNRLDVTDRVTHLEHDMKKIKKALLVD